MYVTWLTFDDTLRSTVEYGDNLELVAEGSSTMFEDGGDEKLRRYIHRVLLKDLIPGKSYSKYQCC
jgi:hypothetical protein